MASQYYLMDFFQTLESWGLTDVMLPFLLVFVLVFAVLEKTKILGAEKKNFNVVVSLVMALATIIPHVTRSYPLDYDPVIVINRALPSVSILVVAIMMLMILIGVFAHDKVFLGLTMPGWIAFFSVVAIIFIFGAAAGWWQGGVANALEEFFGEDAVAVVIMILVFGIIIAFITGPGEKKEGAWQRLGFNIGELFGGKGKG
jgi:hypothetical protein